MADFGKHKIIGFAQSRVVLFDGKQINIAESQKIRNKSEGFCWGYAGSGPSQLALAILIKALPKKLATVPWLYHAFKEDYLVPLSSDQDFVIEVDFQDWANRHRVAEWMSENGVRV